MSWVILFALMANLNLYFLKDSPNLLVRVVPAQGTKRLLLYYSFSAEKWDSVEAQSYTTHFDAVITPPETTTIVGFYFKYDNQIDDNKGLFYLFEVKRSPRMILPFSLDYVETVLKQARKKILSQTHIDEAITLIDYAEKTLTALPYKKGGEQEIKFSLLLSEVNELKVLVGK
ncbi:MAG: hypothetical protein ABIL22_06995 [candidate division WOR-3 bacterium]